MKLKKIILVLTVLLFGLCACSNSTSEKTSSEDSEVENESTYQSADLQGSYKIANLDEDASVTYLFGINTNAYDQKGLYVYIYDSTNGINEYGTYELVGDNEITFTSEHIKNGTAKLESNILTVTYNDQTYELTKISKILVSFVDE